MAKVNVIVDDSLFEQIKAYGFAKNFPSLSDAIRDLLTKGLLSSNEDIYAPLIQSQVKVELDRFISTMEDRLAFTLDDLVSDLDGSLGDTIDSTRMIGLAALLGISNIARPHDPDSYANEMIERVIGDGSRSPELDDLEDELDDLDDLDD